MSIFVNENDRIGTGISSWTATTARTTPILYYPTKHVQKLIVSFLCVCWYWDGRLYGLFGHFLFVCCTKSSPIQFTFLLFFCCDHSIWFRIRKSNNNDDNSNSNNQQKVIIITIRFGFRMKERIKPHETCNDTEWPTHTHTTSYVLWTRLRSPYNRFGWRLRKWTWCWLLVDRIRVISSKCVRELLLLFFFCLLLLLLLLLLLFELTQN